MAANSCFSSSSRSLEASRLFLKQNKTIDRTAPRRRIIPIANPAFPPALIPPELGAAVAAELAADAVPVAFVDELELISPLAARMPMEPATVEEGFVISVGVPVVWRVLGAAVSAGVLLVVSAPMTFVFVFVVLAWVVGVGVLDCSVGVVEASCGCV
jgi:hypothetical protein